MYVKLFFCIEKQAQHDYNIHNITRNINWTSSARYWLHVYHFHVHVLQLINNPRFFSAFFSYLRFLLFNFLYQFQVPLWQVILVQLKRLPPLYQFSITPLLFFSNNLNCLSLIGSRHRRLFRRITITSGSSFSFQYIFFIYTPGKRRFFVYMFILRRRLTWK